MVPWREVRTYENRIGDSLSATHEGRRRGGRFPKTLSGARVPRALERALPHPLGAVPRGAHRRGAGCDLPSRRRGVGDHARHLRQLVPNSLRWELQACTKVEVSRASSMKTQVVKRHRIRLAGLMIFLGVAGVLRCRQTPKPPYEPPPRTEPSLEKRSSASDTRSESKVF